MGKQVPIVDYLVLDDGAPHLVANRVRRRAGRCTSTAATPTPSAAADRSRSERARRRRQGAHVHDRAPRRAGRARRRTCRRSSTSTAAASVKANLLNVEPSPEHVRFGMDVRLTTYVAGVDDDGTEAVAVRLRAGLSEEKEHAMAERDVWILGASMTKFGRYPDKDLIDLGARGGARRARRRRRHDPRHGRHGRRQPHARPPAASASASRSRSARPASPSTTSPTRARPARPRCAACTWRSSPARPRWASPSASRRWARPACSAARRALRQARCTSRRAATAR